MAEATGDYYAKIVRNAPTSSMRYDIEYFDPWGHRDHDVSYWYKSCDTRWGARRLARRMLKKLRKEQAASIAEIVR